MRPAPPGPLRAVLLDIDDTLLDTRGAFRSAIRHVVGQWMPQLDEAGAEEAVVHWAQDPGGYFRAYTRGEQTFLTQRRLRAKDLHAAFGGPVLDDDAYRGWESRYEAAFRAAWRLADGAADLLDTLVGAGLAVGAVTNMERAYQEDKLAVVGLAGRLPVLVAVDDLGFGKPDPRTFALACRRLGVRQQQAAYIGDELDVDARGATAAGLTGVWLDVHGTGRKVQDVLVARTLQDVPALLGVPRPARGRPAGPAANRFGRGAGRR